MLILIAMWAFLAPPAAACVPTDLEAGVRQLSELRATSEDMSTAVRLAEELESGLLCSESLFQPNSLTAFYQQAGATAMTAGDQQKALHWLTEACRLDPDSEWDVRLGKQAGAVWELARRTCDDLTMGTVRALAPAWVDGQLLPKGGELRVRSGRHLTQFMDCSGGVTTSQIFVSGDQEETVGTQVVQPCAEVKAAQTFSPKGSRALRVGSLALVCTGTAGLLAASRLTVYYASDNYVMPDYHREEVIISSLTYGGAALVGVGATGLTVFPRNAMVVGISGRF